MKLDPARRTIPAFCLIALVAVMASCGGDATGPDPDPQPDPISGVTISAPATSVASGTTLQLTAQVLPSGSPQTVTWSSSNEAVATVSATGMVSGTGPGTATITATSTVDPTRSDAVQITVTCEILSASDVVDGADLPADACYTAREQLTVRGGTLTIGAGVDILFEPNAFLRIESGGSLTAEGTAQKPIRLTSVDPAGTWRGVHFDGSRSSSNVLRYVTIENGGSSGWSGAGYSRSAVLLEENALVEIRNSTITGSGGQGITVYGGSALVFEDNVLSNNAVAAWMHPGNAGSIGRGTRFVDNTQNVVRVAFNNTNTIDSDVTWHALDVPYEIRERVFIDARLTLEPGAVLAFVRDGSAIVRNAGAITAIGTESEPIRFTSAEDLPSYWKGLQITTASPDNVFEHVIFENGGSQRWTGNSDSRAMVYLEGNSRAVFANSTFSGSGHYGLWVPAAGDIPGFDGNVFTENVRALIVHPSRAGSVLPSNRIEGNDEDRIRVGFDNTGRVSAGQSWAHTGAPYLVATRTFVEADLTIPEGVTIEFAQGVSLLVEEAGSLSAEGSDPADGGAPVVFRGAEDVAGFWQGIRVRSMSPRNVFSHVRIANAGSSQWFGGGNSIAALYVHSDGMLAMNDVVFQKSGGLAATVSGTVTCLRVDDGGSGFYYGSGSTVTGCPAP